jgi:glycosyltransferase involved in cell wall biosynthesis
VSLIRAVDVLARRHDDVRLFFLGTRNPNPGVPVMAIVTEIRELCDELGLTDRIVFFNDGWVDYTDRFNYLADADVGVSTHFEHLETTFSFRTRILDYLWAGLPIVATRGDYFGDLVDSDGLGVAVDAGDVEAIAQGLERCLYDPEFAGSCRIAVEKVRPRFEWVETLRPLVEFCRAPHRAYDADVADGGAVVRAPRFVGVRKDLALAREHLADGGVRTLSRRVLSRVRHTVKRR